MNTTVVWSASELSAIGAGVLVFFFCLGFSVWKALSASQSGLYWHISLCMIWLGVVIAAIAGSRAEVWTTAVNIGYAILSLGILLTLGGMVYLALHHLSIYRDRNHHRTG